MRVIMASNASARDVGEVVRIAHEETGEPHRVEVAALNGRLVVSIRGPGPAVDPGVFASMSGVESVEDAEPVYRLAGTGQVAGDERSLVKAVVELPDIGVAIGAEAFVVMAGPCAVEDEDDLLTTAKAARAAGARLLRGGAFKPRTSPYSFQGLGEEGLSMLARVRAETGIGVVTEAMEPAAVERVAQVADIIQIGSRNMQNFPLLREVGRQRKPALLKRGMSSTLEEWLGAAEYVLSEGNPNVILCERGIRTFSKHSRHTLDIGVVPAIRERSGLPVVVDPSHATGSSSRVPPMAKAALAAGADGLLVEIHPEPSRALSDGFQTLSLEEFATLMNDLRRIASAVGRTL
jgi:3-deoxy-7-phosphoheptulonate synthase